MMKRAAWVFAGLAAILAAGELAGRALGLHTPVLYEATAYGYRIAPNQDIRRFGSRVFINAQGLRSEPIAPAPSAGVLRVLCIGDSITYGGTLTDQRETYPYLLQRMLEERGLRAEVLNASAPGWALQNAEGWLRAHGTIGSNVVVVEVATHDLFQPKAASETVDNHPSFPSRPPALALEELLFRYVLPRLLGARSVADPGVRLDSRSDADVNRAITTLEHMHALVRAGSASMIVLAVEQPAALEPTDPLTRAAKLALRDAMSRLDVPVVTTSRRIEQQGGTALFHDGLHPNARGNRVLAEILARALVGH
jgi:lysophospholipase L1-like esterase